MPPPLRAPLLVPTVLHPSDTQNPDNDPNRLLKLSHSLRYHLAQPLSRGQPAQAAQYAPGTASPGDPQGWPPQQPGVPQQPSPRALHMHLSQATSPPPLQGQGTRSGPYTGFASKDWLQHEVRHDVDSLRQHVDEYASKREQRAFDQERTVLKAEIAELRKRLADSEAKVVKLELMLPADNGDFRRLRAELEELEQEADHFCTLYERHATATKAALSGFRQALEDVNDIEQEFGRIRQIIATIPEPAVSSAAGAPYMLYSGQTGGGVGTGATAAYQQQPLGAPQQAGVPSPEAASSSACCGCFRFGRRS